MIKAFLLLSFWFQASYGLEPIRVRIFSVPPMGIEVSGDSLQIQDARVTPASLVPVETARITFQDIFGSQWKVERNDNLKIVNEPFLKIVGKNVRVNMNLAPGKILLKANDTGNIDVIAVMNIEEYLAGVLPHEMPPTWPVDALKAQVVAARSYAVAQMKMRKSRPYHVDSTIDDQVFRFQDARVERFTSKVRKVVRETKGTVLRNDNGTVMMAYYHAHCGGRTEQAHVVWDNGDKNPTAKDDHCSTDGSDQWTFKITVKEIERKLKLKKITEVKPYARSPSGRVQSIVIRDEAEDNIVLTGQELRSKLGFKKLRSTLFDIQVNKGLVQFVGRGFGHGVGLCQVGSRALAAQGSDYVAILRHYFPKANLGKL